MESPVSPLKPNNKRLAVTVPLIFTARHTEYDGKDYVFSLSVHRGGGVPVV